MLSTLETWNPWQVEELEVWQSDEDGWDRLAKSVAKGEVGTLVTSVEDALRKGKEEDLKKVDIVGMMMLINIAIMMMMKIMLSVMLMTCQRCGLPPSCCGWCRRRRWSSLTRRRTVGVKSKTWSAHNFEHFSFCSVDTKHHCL